MMQADYNNFVKIWEEPGITQKFRIFIEDYVEEYLDYQMCYDIYSIEITIKEKNFKLDRRDENFFELAKEFKADIIRLR